MRVPVTIRSGATLALVSAMLGAAAPTLAQVRVGDGRPPEAATTAPPPPPAAAAPARPRAGAPLPSPRVDLINEAIEQTAPLTRAELLQLRRELANRSLGMTENVSGRAPPRPATQVFQLDLSPTAAAAPAVVRVTPGQGAVVSFLDAAGAPWPVVLADNAAADAGVVVQTFTPHQLSVFVRSPTAMGNVLVALKDLPTSVAFTVVSGQDQTDYSVQLVVPRFKDGPPANVISSSVPQLATADLFDYLLRTPPSQARPLKVEGLEGTLAWMTGPSRMVVRTQAQITEAIRHFSLDGTGVFEVRLSPLVMASHNGKLVELRVSGF